MANDCQRLLFKAKSRKIKGNITYDESVGACESASKIEKRPRARKVLKKRKVDHVKKNNKVSIKQKHKKKCSGDRPIIEEPCHEDEHIIEGIDSGRSANVDNWEGSIKFQTLNEVDSYIEPKAAASEAKIKTKKLKKGREHKNKSHDINVTESYTEETQSAIGEEMVDEISLVDEDCTRGIKKWLMQYKERRPGLKVLQQRIDEFVTAHEERQEQERKDREARAAEGGWTVVVHHKGRKRTTDAETGTPVGSVALASVTEKMSKNKSKEIALDFYRFQKREAKRNEVMMLQSKFEQDKKRIQQLRAARKFRPY